VAATPTSSDRRLNCGSLIPSAYPPRRSGKMTGMKIRIALGALLLVTIAAAPVCEGVLFNPHLEPGQLTGEDIFMRQFWSVASPTCATIALGLLFAPQLRRIRGWLALIAASAALFAVGAWSVR
jgi:hypothetical protein